MHNIKSLFLIALSLWPITTLAADSDSVSSDGSIPTPAVLGSNLIDSGYVGTGSTSNLNILGVDTTLSELNEIQRIAESLPVANTVEPNFTSTRTVIGLDTKVQLKPATYPYRATALITIGQARCTGWMAGPNTVITAGHCVHRGIGQTWYPLSDYTVYPAHDGTTAPYGKCNAKKLYTTEGWALSSKTEYDYGAIKLNCQVGNATGWLGFAVLASTQGLPAIISGYPGDKPLGQWGSFDSIRKEAINWVFYKNDTYGGMSGAPVWYDAGNRVLAFAIHNYAVPPNFNRGARITKSTFKNIKTWKNAQ